MVGRVWQAVACAAAVTTWAFAARAASLEEMAETIRALQARVEMLEGRSHRDRVGVRAARRERPVPVQIARSLVTKDSPLVVESMPPTVANGFEGAYATVLGGYAFGPDRQPGASLLGFENTTLSAISGGRVGVSAGYNRVIDGLLFGVEGRIRTDFGNTSATGIQFNAAFGRLPFTFAYGGAAQSSYSDFQLSDAAAARRVLSREAGGDVAARFGITVDDWLFYGRLGAGMESLRAERTLDQSGTITCVNPIVRSTSIGFSGFASTVIGCGSQRSGGVTRTVDTFASPYVVVGMGIERNFGPLFARVEGNLYLNLPPSIAAGSSSGTSYSTEVLGAVGYRF